MFFIYLILILLIHESVQDSEVSNHIHNQKREETEDQRELSGKDAEIVFNGEDKNAVYWRRRSKILKDVKKTRVESLFDKHVIIQIIQ